MTKMKSEIHARLGLAAVAAEDDEELTGTLVAFSGCLKYIDGKGNVLIVPAGLDQEQIDLLGKQLQSDALDELEAQV